MAWSWANRGAGGCKGDPWTIDKEPESKRRKVSPKPPKTRKPNETADDWGDDSMELTQAELETLDVMTSQVLTDAPCPSKSGGESFVKPSIPLKSSTNRSSSSSDSSVRPSSSLSTLHSSDTSSASLSSHSASNGFGQSDVVSGGDANGNKLDSLEAVRSELEKTVRQAQDEKYKHDGEVKYLRQSLHKQESELEKFRTVRDETADQQKQIQSDKEKNLQLQVERLTSQAHFKEREFVELQQMLQTLQNKLRDAEKQGKSNPSPEQKPCSPRKIAVKPSPPSKLKQQQLQREEDQISSSQRQSFPTCSSFLEKTLNASPSKQQSALETTVTSGVHPVQTSGESRTRNPVQQQTRSRRLKLNAVCPNRQGNEVLRATIQPCLDSGKQPDPGLPGLLHAMSTSLSLDSLSFCRIKDTSFPSPFKPKSFRQPHTQVSSLTESTESSAVQVVSQENFHLALQGLEMLLSESKEAGEDMRTKFFQNKTADNVEQDQNQIFKERNKTSQTTSCTKSGKSSGPSSSLSVPSMNIEFNKDSTRNNSVSFLQLLNSRSHQAGAVLLLPMLCDYLHHYVELLHSVHSKRAAKAANPVSVSSTMHGSSSVESLPLYTSTSSCSYDSNLDSLSTSVWQLLQDGKVYANAIEKHAISALRCLNILIQLCPILTSLIVKSCPPSRAPSSAKVTAAAANELKTGEGSSVKMKSVQLQNTQKQESESDADDEKSTSSSEVRIIRGSNPALLGLSPALGRHSSNELTDQSTILHLATALAGEDVEDGNASLEAVEESLRFLAQLCYNCTDLQVPLLENIIDRGILSSAFRQGKYPPILLQGQKLCRALASRHVLQPRLCNKSESCPLYMMYRLGSSNSLDKSSPIAIEIYVELISFLSTMSIQHRNGLCPFVINSCLCSEELVVSVILATHKLFAMYIKNPADSDSLLRCLLQAVVVLHSLAQGDTNFLQHHAPVQLTYVRLLSQMAVAFKPLRLEWEWHVSALEELCDVEPELNESSQDSEGEDRMDV